MCDHPNREAAMESVVWCDPCLAPLVRALNHAGFGTTWSCCGHGRRPGMIGLADGRHLVIARDDADTVAIEALFPTDINGNAVGGHAPWFARLRSRLSRRRDGDVSGRSVR